MKILKITKKLFKAICQIALILGLVFFILYFSIVEVGNLDLIIATIIFFGLLSGIMIIAIIKVTKKEIREINSG